MTDIHAYILGMGVISSLGQGMAQTKAALKTGKTGIKSLRLFETTNQALPVGEVDLKKNSKTIPRTHELARIAAQEAMQKINQRPEAVIMGVTTGGMFSTELELKAGNPSSQGYLFHSPSSVAEYLARIFQCKGPVMTVSTACSSGAAAISIALEMLRAGKVKSVLAGGVDSLCRLTYYGFHSLQLIDPRGAHPLDKDRKGMSVAEGAAMLFLASDKAAIDHAVAEIRGAGLSCDAYHPTTPHPQGRGALNAMESALKDAGVSIADIDYINLHGTGTIDNDLSEARAMNSLFGTNKPYLSSVKGAFGHSLAASGAIEAVVSGISIHEGWIPANTGAEVPDPELNLNPVLKPIETKVQTVLSNSFGFGGNNASLVISKPGINKGSGNALNRRYGLLALGYACFTGAGNLDQTLASLSQGKTCKGRLSLPEISQGLSPRTIRRLKRLPRFALSLSHAAYEHSGLSEKPGAIFMGTGWGALSETYDFLNKLYESEEQFSSPTDFVGSVHNAPGGQAAISFQSTGPNITTTGGDYSFEQALMSADLLAKDEPFLVIAADEFHERLSPLFDESVRLDDVPSDGGGAIYFQRNENVSGIQIFPGFFEYAENNPLIISSLIQNLGGSEKIKQRFGAVFAGLPGGHRKASENQLEQFLSQSGFTGPVIDYRKFLGEFASVSGAATVLALSFMEKGEIPSAICENHSFYLKGKSILIMGLGKFITALEIRNFQ